MRHILGLTGNIASGKTTVGLMLLELGATAYIDADLVVHELYLPGQPLVAELVKAFGPAIQDPGGGINRHVLGQIVFGNPEKLRLLESLVHPAVRTALLARLRELPEGAVGVLDAVKLIESGYGPLCDGVWVVTCPPDEQIRRLVGTRELSESEAQVRVGAQPPVAPKLATATEVIENNGALDHLRQQVTAAWERFRASLATNRQEP